MDLGPGAKRREFLRISVAGGAALILNSCGGQNATPGTESSKQAPAGKPEEKGGEVTATEDLMREHGVLRRALLVYSEAAARLRSDPSAVAPDALQKAATLFRDFGEEYHERKLEEAYIFPAVKKAGGPAGGYPDILITQHARGREVTDYILAVTNGAKLGTVNGAQLAGALDSLVRMYRAHASREDTIVFPAWKQTLTAEQLDEMNDRFEDIEHEQFGEDGFEDAVKQISEIESALGLADLARFTAPPPPAL
ncbi:MAG TPA: hemerythrin domain-containing protein [Blastocatellia bacterium]|jgi:hemerythrin-like domain-containing protein|nr:hemerythrin domain-containing protein [Blastocatellia bacterium]